MTETADTPVARLVERARVDARREALAEAADVAQRFQTDASMEDVDPRVIVLLKIAISDEIRHLAEGARQAAA